MLELDRRGIPGVAIFSEEFVTAIEAWTNLHGFEAASVLVGHPIQPLTDEQITACADAVYDQIVAAISRH